VVALDFGTTFSGIAYALANAEKLDVVSIIDWPGMSVSPNSLVPETKRAHNDLKV
jgi:hypothetical protein